MGTARKSIKDFEFLLEEVRAKLDEFETPDDSMGVGGLPKLYYFGNTTAENFYLVAGLFLKFPQLNKMICSDPLGLYSEFKKRLDVHKQFLSLYL